MLHVRSEAINHLYLMVTSLFLPGDGARVPLANGVLCQTLTDALQPCPAPRFIIWDFSYLQTQLHCTKICSSPGTSSRPRDVSYGEQHCLPFCLLPKTQRLPLLPRAILSALLCISQMEVMANCHPDLGAQREAHCLRR